MKRIASRFGDDVDHGPGFSAEFRVVVRLQHVEFADGVGGGAKYHIIKIFISYVYAVYQEQVVPRSVPHHVDQLAGLLQRVSPRSPGRADHALAQEGQLQKLAPLQWKIRDLLILNDILDFGRLKLQQLPAPFHCNDLALRSECEVEIRLVVSAHVKYDLFLDSLLEPGRRDRQSVFAKGKLRKQELSRFVRDRAEFLLCRRVHAIDSGASDDRAGAGLNLA
jgi:hypothetical protein